MKNELEIIQELKRETEELKTQLTTINSLKSKTFIDRGRYNDADVNEVALLPGVYYFGLRCTNMPPNSESYCKIINLDVVSYYTDSFQIGFGIIGGKISCRTKNNGIWQAWKSLH